MGGTTVECKKCGVCWRITCEAENICPNCGEAGVSVWKNYDDLTKEQKEKIFNTKVKPLMPSSIEDLKKND